MLKIIAKMHIRKCQQVGLGLLVSFNVAANNNDLNTRADAIVDQMSVHEKVGKKIMMAFRYWCDNNQANCTTGMIQYKETVGAAIAENHINSVILFSDNLTDITQTIKLISKLKLAADRQSPLGLFIAIDQEGGNVVRLPRAISTIFPGNMALGAAYQATQDATLAYQKGKVLATEIRSVGFNLNFAPVVDTNSNPLNQVINVHAFGDDPQMVTLGSQLARGMADQGVGRYIQTFSGLWRHGYRFAIWLIDR